MLAAANQTGIEVISLLFLIAGFVGVFALWYGMVFKPGRDERRRRDAGDEK